jgi:hypothetical protein
MKKISRVSIFLGWALLSTLVLPNLLAACECIFPSCTGGFCYCCKFSSVCQDSPAPNDPCGPGGADFSAGPAELAAFKARIDAWSEKEDLRAVVEAATDLYNSVFFQDSQRFVEASNHFQEAIKSLPEQARKGLQSAATQARHE